MGQRLRTFGHTPASGFPRPGHSQHLVHSANRDRNRHLRRSVLRLLVSRSRTNRTHSATRTYRFPSKLQTRFLRMAATGPSTCGKELFLITIRGGVNRSLSNTRVVGLRLHNVRSQSPPGHFLTTRPRLRTRLSQTQAELGLRQARLGIGYGRHQSRPIKSCQSLLQQAKALRTMRRTYGR